jgi:hypothetical protein
MYCAGAAGTHPWNGLVLDLQERILLHLPLHDLGRAAFLGKAFWCAFKHRLLEAEEGVTSAAIAAYGEPLLAGVARVLQRYRRGIDLLTGRGALLTGRGARQFHEFVLVDGSGTVTKGRRLQPSIAGHHASVRLRPATELSENVAGVRKLSLLLDAGHGYGPKLTLFVPAPDSSNPYRFLAAILEMQCLFPHSQARYPWKTGSPLGEHLGAFLVIARLAAEGCTCQETPRASGQVPRAPPVGPPFSGGECPVQPSQENPRTPLQSNSGGPTDVSQSLLQWSPLFQTARHLRVLSHDCAFTWPHVSKGLDQGIATAVVLAAVLQVPCCHVRLQPLWKEMCRLSPSSIGACRDSHYCCLGYPLNVGAFFRSPDPSTL